MRRSDGAATGRFYRAVWRWHFYAGLAVLPLLVWLAVTGALYLYKPEIERLLYRAWLQAAPERPPLPIDAVIAAVERQLDGRVTQLMLPASKRESWQATVVLGDGSRRTAFVDPADGKVKGSVPPGGAMKQVRDLHSLVITGSIGNALVEIAAGWAILLVLSGFYLWWPRSPNRALALRGKPRERRFWRDFHASAGALVGLVLLFLALTGMPWSGRWGRTVQAIVASNGLGRPPAPGPAPWELQAGHGGHGRETLPWSRQAAPAPAGRMRHGGSDIGAARAAAIATAHGLLPPWTMSLPAAPGAPYMISRTIRRADDARALYIDAADGRVLQDARYADFGKGAQAIEWGIAVHQGQQYGEINRLIMLAGCLGTLALALSAPVLCWKRRSGGQLRAPPVPDRHSARIVAAMMVAVGALFPLTGATMIAALIGEFIAGRFSRSRP
ncbi:PepSY-associated TM helix domain-containing protein [Sphingomonas sanxanigenens]|uniref:PepSY-associated TM helix domain-containing protein n=1 Tax=Sphingomonas sanxanigenens TaxID=397260 RepID=UPI0004B07631|nr:PepSY domain-containing protein [Sphingomonas sanxanigenens]